MRHLEPAPLTRESFRHFGDVIDMAGSAHFTINQGFAERFNDSLVLSVNCGWCNSRCIRNNQC